MGQSVKTKASSVTLKPGDDILTCYELLKDAGNRVFFFRIDDFTPEHVSCIEWFVNDFLKLDTIKYPDDLHILIMYQYLDMDASVAPANRDVLLKLFNLRSAFQLDNVTQKDIYRWIALFEDDDSSPFKLKLLELLDNNKDYPMQEIFRQYEKAQKEIPDHEKF
jgi:hypothetical protein